MRVLQFAAQNIQRVEAIDITPDEFIVEIAGKNRQGKSSAIHCLSMAIEGAKAIHKVPIREGAEEGIITITLGSRGKGDEPDKVDMVVRREFSKREATKSDPKLYATKLTLTLADGQQPRKAQEILSGLYNTVCSDPLSFTKLSAKEQFDKLRAMVPGFDFEAHDNKQRADFQRRTDVNRDAARAKAAADVISVPSGTPDELVDEKIITDAMANAGTHNGEIERRKLAREQAAEKVAKLREDAQYFRDRIPHAQKGIDDDIAELERKIVELRERSAAETQELEEKAVSTASLADDLQKRLDEAPELPDPVDTAALQEQLRTAQATNANVREKRRKAEQTAAAEAFKKEAEELTARMAARDEEKTAAIRSAKLPVDGLSFGDGEILLNGLPFEQASFREQLVTSCAIAMANKPEIKILHVADGNAMDEDGWAILRDLAQKNDWQIWVESVAPQTDTAIILENGKVKA